MKLTSYVFVFLLLLTSLFYPLNKTEAFFIECTNSSLYANASGPDVLNVGEAGSFSIHAQEYGPNALAVSGTLSYNSQADIVLGRVVFGSVMDASTNYSFPSPGFYTLNYWGGVEDGGAGRTCGNGAVVQVVNNVHVPLGTICVASNLHTTGTLYGPNHSVPFSGTSFCIDDDAGAWTISDIPTIAGYNGPFLSPSTATQTVGDGGAISWNITYTPIVNTVVNGSCGSAATSYPPSATNFSGSFCSSGNASPSSPAFPGQGGNVSWTCQGSGGGSNATCSADHQNVVVTATDNSAYISQNVPIRMVPGQTYPVSIVMKNTGTSNWVSSSAYALGSQNPQDNTTWFGGRIGIPSAISPNSNGTFNFNVTAPSVSGTYNFQTRMTHDLPNGSIPAQWFGEFTPNLSIVVQPMPDPTNLSLSCPSPGTTVTATWSVPSGYNTFYIRANPGANNWTYPSVIRDENYVGLSYSFPSVAGQTYSFWIHTKDPITGDFSTGLYANVTCGGGLSDNATYISQDVPARLNPGATANVSVTMQNSGSSTWLPSSNYGLGTQNPADNTIFGPTRHYITSQVSPGASYTFNYSITCPNTPGTYYFQNKMAHDIANGPLPPNWFGQITPNTPIQCQPVKAPTNLTFTCPTPGTTAYANWSDPSGYNNFFIRVNKGANNGTFPSWISVPENGESGIGTSYTFSTTPGQSYYMWIHTRDPNTGESSTAIAANVKCAPPPPSNLTLSCPSPGTQVNASWTNPGGYTSFLIRANQGLNNNTFPSLILNDNYTGTTYSFPSTPGQTYFYWMHTLDSATGDYSAAVTGNVSCVNTSINGQCGTANGKNYGAAVTTYGSDSQCNSGTASNTSFPANGSSVNWTCSGQNGGSSSPQCSASRSSTPINGTCGTADGKVYISTDTDYAPDTQCTNGTPNTTAFPIVGGSQAWTCSGQNGGSSASCSASRQNNVSAVDGVCGSANGKTYPSTDSAYSPDVQCSVGSPSNTAFPAIGSTQSWVCAGQNGGSSSPQCSAQRASGTTSVNGVCGSANGKNYPSTTNGYSPDTQCSVGLTSNVNFPAIGSTETWLCSGQNGGSNSPQCSASRQNSTSVVNGVCGSANGKTYPSTATSYSPNNQCAGGSPNTTAFPGIGSSQAWICLGQNGGSDSVQCTASRSSASGNSGPTAPVVSCTNCGGTSANPTGFTGTNYNFSMSCTDPDGDQVAYGVDWNSDSVLDELIPTSGYVNSGTSRNAVNSWNSSGTKSVGFISFDSNGNWSPWVIKDISISNSQVNGICGSANRTYMSTDTSYGGDNLCSSGSISSCSQGSAPNCSFPSAGSSVSWVCAGAFGGSSASCQADRAASLKLVNVSVSNLSGGTVSGPGINCGYSCSATYALNSTITLDAVPTSAYWQFTGWGGDCASFGRAKTCTLTVDGDKTVTATFLPRAFNYSEF